MSCLGTGNGTGARHASVPTNEEEALAVGCTAEQMAECKAKSAEHEVKLAAGLRTPRTTADYVKTWGNELRVDVSDAEGVGMGERFANKGKAPTHDVPGFADGVPAPVWNDAAHPKFVELDAPEDGGRIVIVGDVQGCFNEYNALMKLVNVTDRDIVVLVGDVVHSNSGVKPGPSGTLPLLAQGSIAMLQEARTNPRVWAVRGNHEDAVLQKIIRPPSGSHWSSQLTDEDRIYLERLPMQIRIPSHKILVVHAGIDASAGLNEQRHVVSTKLRNLVLDPATEDLHNDSRWLPVEANWANREKKERHVNAVPWAKLWSGTCKGHANAGGPWHVVFGHDARKGLQMWPYATGLDTGASGKERGALTAMVLPRVEKAKPAGPCDPTVEGRPGLLFSVPYDHEQYW